MMKKRNNGYVFKKDQKWVSGKCVSDKSWPGWSMQVTCGQFYSNKIWKNSHCKGKPYIDWKVKWGKYFETYFHNLRD